MINIFNSTNQEKPKRTPQNIIYPKVDKELCINCGACIDICPANAIIIKDDKAFIVEDLCKNCKNSIFF